MTVRLARLFLPLLAGASLCHAQDPPTARVDSQTTFLGFGFFEGAAPDSYRGRSELSFIPRIELLLPAQARFEGALQLRGDAIDSSRNRLYLLRCFVDLSLGPWDIRAGRQIVRTGKVDGLRPTDYFRRRNFTDFLETDEEPVDAARVDYYVRDWVFTGVFTPYFQADITPLERRNRWTGPLIPPAPPGSPSVELVQSFDLRPSGLSSSELGLWGGRRTGGLDWSVSYFNGHDRLPSSFSLRPAGGADPPTMASEVAIQVLPRYRRLHVVGLDWETTMGSFGVRGEASYTRYERSSESTPFEEPFAMFALGADRTFSRILGSHDLYVNLQYQFDSARSRADVTDTLEFGNPLRHFYRHAVTSLLEYRFDSYKKIVAKAFWNPAAGGYVVQSELNWKLWDGWTWAVGVDTIGGPSDSFFGVYRSNDRARTALTFDWKLWEHRPTPRPEPAPFPAVELQTTAWVDGEWVAMIDGRLVRSGDTIEGAKVVTIADGFVQLEIGGRRFALGFVTQR